MANIIRKNIQNIGLLLVYIGATLLIGCCFFAESNANTMFLLSLLLVITGIIVHIIITKKESKY